MSTENDPAATAPAPLPPFADALADAIARAAPAVVAIQAGSRTASGLVWSAGDGHVVTTTRLLQRHRGEVRVLFADGDARAAALIGYDDATELALLSVEGCPSGDVERVGTDGLRVGHLVAPVARNLYGVRAAFGMISGLAGAWVTPKGGAVDTWIDVDGQLPPGFSGGPLVDLAGRVIGVNTRGILREGAVIPASTVERVVTQLAAGGSVTRGFLGVGVQSVALPDSVAEAAGQPQGLLITWVGRDSAAALAGLMAGDTIVAVDDRPIARLADLMAALSGRANAEVAVRYVRAGALADVTATAGARPEPRGVRHEHLDHGGHDHHGGRGPHDSDHARGHHGHGHRDDHGHRDGHGHGHHGHDHHADGDHRGHRDHGGRGRGGRDHGDDRGRHGGRGDCGPRGGRGGHRGRGGRG